MKVGMALMWQNVGSPVSDLEAYEAELALAHQAEPLGFDALWTVEHHFTDYSMCPDPLQFLSYMAGRTSRIQLGTMVIVLPWHDPIRVAEQVVLLDILSGGRLIVGVGRGLGRIEFEGFGIPMDESRGRFAEAAEIVAKALEFGKLDYDGQYYKIPPRDLRPEPTRSFSNRLYAGSITPESSKAMAELGYSPLVIPQKPYEVIAADLEQHAAIFREVNGREPSPPACALFVFCHEDPDQAHELGQRHIANYYESTIAHYELGGSHFASTKGYELYSKTAEFLNNNGGVDAAAQAFVNLHAFGTPEQVIEKIRTIHSALGNDTLMVDFRFGGMDRALAESSAELFAREVLPTIQQFAAPA